MAANDGIFGHIMTALRNPLLNSYQREIGIRQPDIKDAHGVSLFFRLVDEGQLAAPGKGGFKAEIFAAPDV